MKHIIAVSTNTYHGFTIDQALEGIAAAGFKYVELTAVRNWTEHVMPDMADSELDRVQAKMKALGLECVALSGHCNLTDAGRLNDFRANMALAERFGARYIISSTGEAHFGKDEAFADDVLIENIKNLLPDLERHKLKLGIEVHGEYGTGEAVARVVKGVGSPLVGVNFDTANVVYYGAADPMKDLQKSISSVNYVHLKDKVGMDKSWNFPAIGKGELDLVGMISYLDTQGKNVPLSIEVEFTEDFTMRDKVEGDLEHANREVRDSFDFLRKNGLI
ncbi:MAG: sugar phosphate isomerase/epimerase [Eubacteriales bacterium]|nr:sugar phosphate isomerase/epimerase [Eubacteriales bacterium]